MSDHTYEIYIVDYGSLNRGGTYGVLLSDGHASVEVHPLNGFGPAGTSPDCVMSARAAWDLAEGWATRLAAITGGRVVRGCIRPSRTGDPVKVPR